MKCLIVDSSKSSRAWLGQIVNESGFEYMEAETGSEGIKTLQENSFDLIFTPMYLNDMDGIGFASMVRANSKTRRLPLVMITTQEDKQILERALSVGVTEIFSKRKPDSIKDFVARFFLQHSASSRMQGHILYVEDSRAIAMKIQQMLETQGLTINHFTNAEDALSSFQQENYDLVLTDVMLEGQMSGYGLLQAIRNTEGKKGRIPVLAMTGFNDETRKIELLVAGANDYVTKPPVEAELIARVRNHITSKRQSDLIEEQYTKLQELAMHDQLTRLYNRHFLMEIIPAKLSESRRHKRAISIIVVDIDKFKNINDTHGHGVGDLVLKGVAESLQKNCRTEDVVARFGGEEFVMLLTACEEEFAGTKADKLRQMIAELKPSGYPVTASFGVAQYNTEEMTNFNDMFNLADRALYIAKETGRNKVVLGSSLKK